MKNSDLDVTVLQECICANQMRVVVDPLRTQKSAETFI